MHALLLAVAASAAPPLNLEPEILVTARRIAQVSLTLGRDAQGRTTCGLSRSSGDDRIDRAMCKRASRCIKRKPEPIAKIDACIAKQKKALLAAWKRGERS